MGDGEDVEPNEETENAAVDEEVVGKRGINYQISKNKGLTPHRPKEQRNPRVKHRMNSAKQLFDARVPFENLVRKTSVTVVRFPVSKPLLYAVLNLNKMLPV